MNSREKILNAIMQNQPPKVPLPDIGLFKRNTAASPKKFAEVLLGIGGQIYFIDHLTEIENIITDKLNLIGRTVNLVDGLKMLRQNEVIHNIAVHDLHDVVLAVIVGKFAVAENGAVWITEDQMGQRALPFICENLAVVIHYKAIVPTMHEAYELLNNTTYGYGCFIAGPSKTADIEQSLVIGAHGPKSMTVFVLST